MARARPGGTDLIHTLPPLPCWLSHLDTSEHSCHKSTDIYSHNWMVHTTPPRLSMHPTCLGNLSQPRRQGLPASPKPQLPRARPGLEDWNC